MEKDYMYFRGGNDKICRVHVERDDEPWNPRTEDEGNIGHMMVWWNRYSLGDTKENTYSSPEDFLNDLVRRNVDEKSIINFAKAKRTSNGLELKYNKADDLWELWGYYYWSLFGEKHEPKFAVIESNNPVEHLVDDIIEAMSFEDKWKMLERNGFYRLPLYIYEHSGLTISTGAFSCRWDSGQAGWIYTTKEDVLKVGGKMLSDKGNHIKVTDRNWKKAALRWLQGEVETYDMYLQGEVYGYVVDELEDEEDDDWNENTDSCWGFYSNKYGDALVKEIVEEGLGETELFASLEELKKAV